MATVTMERGPRTTPGGLWDKYNIIAASQRVFAKADARINHRGAGLFVFWVFFSMFVVLASLWVMMDLLSTWDWTDLLNGDIQAGADEVGAVTSVASAALLFRWVLQFLSVLPTAFELSAPMFADQDDLLAGLFVLFTCFDFYTDWGKSAELAGRINFNSWGDAAGFGQWLVTVFFTLFFSLGVQYIGVLCLMIAIAGAWAAVRGGRA